MTPLDVAQAILHASSPREGKVYPEGDFSTTTTFDICGDCFNTKLVPWMESQGAKPFVKDTNE